MNSKHDELSRAQVERAGLPGPGEEPHFLPHPVMDRLLEAVIVLGGELWIERDRRRALESLLYSKGLLTPEEIETHSEADAEERHEELAALVTRLFDPLRSMRSGDGEGVS
jgi:hypothetical protein